MLPVRHCHVYHPHAGIAVESLATGHLKHDGGIMRTVTRVATRLNRRRQLFASVERALLSGPRPPIVLCLSQFIRAIVERHYSLPPDRLAMLFNAVDLDRFTPGAENDIRKRFGIGPEKIVGLLLANDFERKGLREAIKATAKLRDDRFVLLVAGRQNPRPYAAFAKEIGVKNVIFAGRAADSVPFYRAADYFVLPTRHDPCSLVVLEALAMGLPVISTRFNGACEIMTDGQHGFVLNDPADLVTLADSMRTLLDPQRRAAMSAACLALRPQLAYGRHLDELEATYRRAVL
jgi:UDP-glucose:(heptosyl)LPS alpha-1,3-glucosyltransferase